MLMSSTATVEVSKVTVVPLTVKSPWIITLSEKVEGVVIVANVSVNVAAVIGVPVKSPTISSILWISGV